MSTHRSARTIALGLATLLACPLLASADPCGMVPPVWDGPGPAITRVGAQQTYVFYKEGVESFVIRPGFSGKVDEFGMLIPFPSVPAIRKVEDDIFKHVANAVTPPPVVVDLRPRPELAMLSKGRAAAPGGKGLEFKADSVRVLKQEAVGMYEVAVLAAGSAGALKRWMDDHGYQYPKGMDGVTQDYVNLGWCFVAVKTKVGQKKGVTPRPGMRRARAKLPRGSVFDGNVQAMGFRFKTPELVVPMRLSAFNAGQLHNTVYLLTDRPMKIDGIDPALIKKQIPGPQLFKHVTDLLPLKILGGTIKDLSPNRLRALRKQRNPVPKNGFARDLFASDLQAVRQGLLTLPHEEREKVLLAIGERLGLRGAEVDAMHRKVLAAQRAEAVKQALEDLKHMTLTVVDGNFPRQVLADANLSFSEFVSEGHKAIDFPVPVKIGKATPPKPLGAELVKQREVEVQEIQTRQARQAAGKWLTIGLVAVLAGLCVVLSRGASAALLLAVCLAFGVLGPAPPARADPCGMVPPVWNGPGPAITRVGAQQTYVFYKEGVESFVIRPSFSGKVDTFGMLIPFPAVPALRKVDDAIFDQLKAAVDPPQVVVRIHRWEADEDGGALPKPTAKPKGGLRYRGVKVLKQEAVGMYEVAVLAAGSAQALKKWMDDHGYRYPKGMDKVTQDYVNLGWCFVAVKTKVGQKQGVTPRPGMRKAHPKLPQGATFDGNVQAMGFRFKTPKLVVPMRLSAFNAGKLYNKVYLLSDRPMKIDRIPANLVKRQLPGKQLVRNLTQLLPLKIIGGNLDDVKKYYGQGYLKTLRKRRDPVPKNGQARDLFVSDLEAVRFDKLSLPHEEREKVLLKIGERLGMRGPELDALHRKELARQRGAFLQRGLQDLAHMTLTVIEGDFPRDVLAKDNLTFSAHVKSGLKASDFPQPRTVRGRTR